MEASRRMNSHPPFQQGLALPKCVPRLTTDLVTFQVTLEASETGFYYFIFANENELTDNFLFADFRLHKTTFDVSRNRINCTNATECNFPLAFWYEPQSAPRIYHILWEEGKLLAIESARNRPCLPYPGQPNTWWWRRRRKSRH